MNVKLTRNDLSIDEFNIIRESIGLSALPCEQISKALENSIVNICARIDGKAIGMGRLVGDGAYVYYLQNINIDPEYQKLGIGTLIINELLKYIKENKIKGTSVMVLLMSSKGKEKFYKRFGFRLRPNDDEGPGMIMNVN